MGIVRWLRQTASRQVPQWLLYLGVVTSLLVLAVLHYVFLFEWLPAMAMGLILGVVIASALKLIWAAMNPVSDSDGLDQ